MATRKHLGFMSGATPLQAIDPQYVSRSGLADPYAAPAAIQTSADFRPGLGEKPPAGPEPWKPSMWEVVGNWLDGQSPSQALESARGRHMAPLREEELRELINQVTATDPRERLTYLTDDKAWAKNVAENYAPETIPEGDTRQRPGYGAMTAPKMGVDGGQGYTQTPKSFEVTGARDPSYGEVTAAEKARLEAIQKEQDLQARIARWSRQDGVAAARERRLSRGAPGGGGAAPARPAMGGRILGSNLPDGY